jgi:hypothetical protein
MSLVPVNRLLSYSFRQLDLASGYGEGMIKADALTRNNPDYPFTGRTRDVPLTLFRYRGAAQDGGTLCLKLVNSSPTDTALMQEDSNPSLASGIFSRGDSKTQTQNLTKTTPPDEFNFQLNVALPVDFLQGGIERPLLDVGPKFKRRVLNNSSRIILNVFQTQNLPQGTYADSLVPDHQVLLRP